MSKISWAMFGIATLFFMLAGFVTPKSMTDALLLVIILLLNAIYLKDADK